MKPPPTFDLLVPYTEGPLLGWKVKTRTHPLNGGLLRNARRGQGMGTTRSSGRGVAARRLLACRRSIPDLLAEVGATSLFATRECFGPRALGSRASPRHLSCKLRPESSQLRIQGFSSRRSKRPSRQNVAHANGDQNQRQERGLLQHPWAAARLRDRVRDDLPGPDAALHEAQPGGPVRHAGPRAVLHPDRLRVPAVHLHAARLLLLVLHLVLAPLAHLLRDPVPPGGVRAVPGGGHHASHQDARLRPPLPWGALRRPHSSRRVRHHERGAVPDWRHPVLPDLPAGLTALLRPGPGPNATCLCWL